MFQLEAVTKRFGGNLVAVDRVDLTIRRGEKVAVIGPSGAGKTTLFRLLNLTIPLTSGRLWIGGREVSSLRGTRLREARRKIGTVYQQHNLVPRLRVVHNVLAGRLGSWSLLHAVRSLIRPAGTTYGWLMKPSPGSASRRSCGPGRRSSLAVSSSVWRSRASWYRIPR